MSAAGVLIALFSIIIIILGIKYFFFRDMSFKDFFMLKFLVKNDDGNGGGGGGGDNGNNSDSVDTSKGDTPSIPGAKCEFEGEDILNGYVFSKSGQTIKSGTLVDCISCNQYINKENSECINYAYDKSENESSQDKSDWPGNIKSGRTTPNEGVCTGAINPTGTKCPF